MAFERSKKNFTTKINSDKQVVNTPTKYEVTIAAKLEQLPVPDMADSIWARIEMQLDADLPSDDGDNAPSQDPTRGMPGMGKGFYLSLLAAVIIALVLIYTANKKDKKKINPVPAPFKTEIITPVADSGQSIPIPEEKNSPNIPAVVNKKDSSTLSVIPGNRISFDSVSPKILPGQQPDSPAIITSNPRLPSFDSLPPPPLIKPKGVKGITDNDYRIQEGKKDSAKKGG
jgi:hypothetical protein